MQSQVHATLLRIRAFLKANKGNRRGLLLLLETLTTESTDYLSWKQFSSALQSCGLVIQDIKTLFKAAEKNADNCVSIDAFLRGIRGPLSVKKKEMVEKIFYTVIDKDGDGVASIDDITRCYLAQKHPDARQGRKAPSKILADFEDDLMFFASDGYYRLPTLISFFEFVYCFEEDIDFIDIMKQLWLNEEAPVETMASMISGETIIVQTDIKLNFINRMRVFLRARGIKGLNTLHKCLVKYSEQGQLNLFWFKRALKDAHFSIPETALNQVFFAYDELKQGHINAIQLLNDIKGALSPASLELVEIAFFSLDYLETGTVTFDYLMQVYDTANHPEVLAGRKSSRDEYQDYLDSFNATLTTEHAAVSKAEFLTYYEGLSMICGDDAAFAHIVRSTLHITEEIIAAYHLSLNKVSVPFVNDAEIKVQQALDKYDTADTNAAALPIYAWPGEPDTTPLPAQKKHHRVHDDLEAEIDIHGGVPYLLKRIRAELHARGKVGILNFQRSLRASDGDDDRMITFQEFTAFMHAMFPSMLTGLEVLNVFEYLDSNFEGLLACNDVMKAMRAPLGDKSKRLLALIFDCMDKEGSGVVDAHEIAAGYNAAKHPDVLAGRSTEEAEYKDFLDSFDVGGEVEGCVTRGEFMAYYANVAAAVDDEETFCELIGNTWLQPADVEAFNTKYAQRLAEIQARQPAPANLKHNSFVSREPYDIISLKATSNDIATHSRFDEKDKEKFTIYDPTHSHSTPVDGGVPYILKKVALTLKSRGKAGILSFHRKLRLADSDGDKKVSFGQFTSVMREQFSELLSDSDTRSIFDFLDIHCNHSVDNRRLISISHIMDALRPQLTEKSRRLVALVFDRMDQEGSGAVDAHEIAANYDPSKHPDVLTNRLSAEAAYKDFLDSFDVGGEVEGRVTRGEFIGYFTNVAAVMDSEDQFCQMVVNTWMSKAATEDSESQPERAGSQVELPRLDTELKAPAFSKEHPPRDSTNSPWNGRRRYEGAAAMWGGSELTNDFLFGRLRDSTNTPRGTIKNMHHSHNAIIFPSENGPVGELHELRSGKKHIKLRKSEINFFVAL